MNCTDIEERSAFLQYDGGLSRADADAQAAREKFLEYAGGQPIVLGMQGGLPCGFGHVVADGDTFRMAIGAEPGHDAIIVPAVEDDGIADLVACTMTPQQRMRSRLGIAAVVGLDEIERARETDTPLLVFDHTIRWLYARSPGAVVVDWTRAAYQLEGVKIILCAESLASRLHDATRRCCPRPTIAFAQPEAMRHAA